MRRAQRGMAAGTPRRPARRRRTERRQGLRRCLHRPPAGVRRRLCSLPAGRAEGAREGLCEGLPGLDEGLRFLHGLRQPEQRRLQPVVERTVKLDTEPAIWRMTARAPEGDRPVEIHMPLTEAKDDGFAGRLEVHGLEPEPVVYRSRRATGCRRSRCRATTCRRSSRTTRTRRRCTGGGPRGGSSCPSGGSGRGGGGEGEGLVDGAEARRNRVVRPRSFPECRKS